jgi:hypothetical protein
MQWHLRIEQSKYTYWIRNGERQEGDTPSLSFLPFPPCSKESPESVLGCFIMSSPLSLAIFLKKSIFWTMFASEKESIERILSSKLAAPEKLEVAAVLRGIWEVNKAMNLG